MLEVETATFSEKDAIERKEQRILHELKPKTVCGDDAYTKALRSRQWAKQGVILVTPALRWSKGCYAIAYRKFIKTDRQMVAILRKRKTAIEPIFDLLAKLMNTTGKQKQLKRQGIRNVRIYLAIGVLSLQIAMISNAVWGLPPRTISYFKGAFA